MFLSKPCLDYLERRAIGIDDNLSKLQRKQYHNQNDELENHASNKLRYLIHAYGSDDRDVITPSRELLDANVLIQRPSSMPWQNTERAVPFLGFGHETNHKLLSLSQPINSAGRASVRLRPPVQVIRGLHPSPPLNSIMQPMQNQQDHQRQTPSQLQQLASAFSGLLNSLLAQGVISLTKPNSVQESQPLKFDSDLLKARNESAVKALYGDLPRQCRTCGRRFKSQELCSHMDWQKTKNHMSNSKNRKVDKLSREWFVSARLWLIRTTDAVPVFLHSEIIVEKKSDEECVVPADGDRNVCALCGDSFEEFYREEAEERMYKSAVYLNAPNSSQLGPIVRAKCRSGSSIVPQAGFGQDEEGPTVEGSRRKRLRI